MRLKIVCYATTNHVKATRLDLKVNYKDHEMKIFLKIRTAD